MALKAETTTTRDGTEWTLNTLPATEGLAAATQLAAILGAPAGAVVGGQAAGVSLQEFADAGFIGDAVAKMTARLAERSTVDLVKLLLRDLRKTEDGKPKKVVFDDEFAANYGQLAELIWFSLRLNFASFFGESLGGSDWVEAFKKKIMESIQEASIGGSGE